MGHGDEIVLADAHFPGESLHKNIIRADGLKIPDLLDAILPLIPPDTYVDFPLIMMAAVEGDVIDPEVKKSYSSVIEKYWKTNYKIKYIERFGFYDRAKSAFCIVMTGETAKYGNIILKKGVVAV